MSTPLPAFNKHSWGYLALIAGALSLSVAVLHVFGGPFAPQASIGTTIGEIAADIRASAMRSINGQAQPAPAPQNWDIDRILLVAAPILGVFAIVSAIISSIKRDPWRLVAYGATLGVAAIVLQFLFLLAMMIAGVCLLLAIIENFGEITQSSGG
ncbi:MAG: hypothetical protein ACFB0F_10180 [Neomegalonema sp.]